jgi:hypothetical protein
LNRHLDHYAGREPSRVMRETLKRRGGVNAMGFPVYRMVWSENVMEQVGGLWHEWDADLTIEDRGGIEAGADGRPTLSHHRPDRVVAELRTVPTYSHLEIAGWVVERWYPPAFFGSPQEWASHVVLTLDGDGQPTVPSNIPRLGAYPSQGRYLMIVGPLPKEPTINYVEDYIAWWEQRRASFPADAEQYVREQVELATKRDEENSDRAIRENHDRLMASVSPLTSTSLEAGRWRSAMFERAGHTAHIGN